MKLSSELVTHFTRSLGDGDSQVCRGEARENARVGLTGRGVIIPCPARCGRQPVSVTVRDVSGTGIGLVHHQRLEQNEQFILRIPADGRSPATAVLCTVVHCRPIALGVYMIGAHFTSHLYPAHPPTANSPVMLPVESISAAFDNEASGDFSADEAEQLRQVEARLSRMQSQ